MEQQLASLLEGCRLGSPIHVHETLPSTMDEAHRLAAEGAKEGTLVVALQQAHGRGRLGRVWESPEGGVYASIILRPRRSPGESPQLALVTGLAAGETIRDTAGLYPSIRWPNDLLLDGKKVGGILTEARDRSVVVGVGINVGAEPSRLPEGGTSLAAAGAAHVSREAIITRLCWRLSTWYDIWTQGGFPAVREALRPWIGHFGQPVSIAAGTERFEGVASDIDERGRLVVRLDAGTLRAFEMGEVSLLR